MVELASLQTAFLTLDEAIKTTNRRVNALDSVVKPMLENTIQYIKVRNPALHFCVDPVPYGDSHKHKLLCVELSCHHSSEVVKHRVE